MMFSRSHAEHDPSPESVRALQMFLILHADHEQNCSTARRAAGLVPDPEVRRHHYGNPASQIVQSVETAQSDLIVISTHGRTGLKRFFSGSVAEKMVRWAGCPVLTPRTFGKTLLRDESDTETLSR